MNTRPTLCAALLLCGAFTATTLAAEAAGSGAASTAVSAGSEIHATLERTVDAGITGVGTEVSAKVTRDLEVAGKVVVPKGAKLVGRITRAEVRRSRGSAGGISASEFDVVFDRAVLRNGKALSLNGEVVALGTPKADSRKYGFGGNSTSTMTRTAEPGSGGPLGGIGGRPGRATAQSSERIGGDIDEKAADKTARSAGAYGGLDEEGALIDGSRGVFGIEDLEIGESADGTVQSDVLLSRDQNVRIDRGTLLLVVAGEPASGN